MGVVGVDVRVQRPVNVAHVIGDCVECIDNSRYSVLKEDVFVNIRTDDCGYICLEVFVLFGCHGIG